MEIFELIEACDGCEVRKRECFRVKSKSRGKKRLSQSGCVGVSSNFLDPVEYLHLIQIWCFVRIGVFLRMRCCFPKILCFLFTATQVFEESPSSQVSFEGYVFSPFSLNS
ncbi:hypothetical protein C1H46_023601 [Malus baccata]|uniref:Uncharacterized protein n=1 Tax=Malus baccata TaxID=106549 RepID=A0A540LWI1_MALBA|nr:hypothetical protein C1H46_023601 [Malus baccata]